MRELIFSLLLMTLSITEAASISQDLEDKLEACLDMPAPTDRTGCILKLTKDHPEEETFTNWLHALEGLEDLKRSVESIEDRVNVLYPEPEWDTWEQIDPIDDTVTVAAAIDSVSGASIFGEKVAFVVFCQDGETVINIRWREYFGDERESVTTRIGNQQAKTEDWNVSTSKTVTILSDGSQDLLEDMMTSDRFVARVTPYREPPITAVFNTAGLKTALKPIMETCDWSM